MIRRTVLLLLLAAVPARAETIINAASYMNAKSPTFGIQDAIDALPPEGGTVQLPEGRFPIECFIQLRAGVTLKGRGEKTIIAGGRNEQRVAVTADAPSGSKVLAVSDVSGLSAGQTVYVMQDGQNKGNSFPFVIESVDAKAKTIQLSSTTGFALKANESQIGYGLYAMLAARLKSGDSEIAVTDVAPFREGDSIVFIGDYSSGPVGYGWGIEENIVTEIDPKAKILKLKKPVWVSAFPRIVIAHGYGGLLAMGGRTWNKPATKVVIEDLVVEGWKGDVKPHVHQFFLGAVTFVDCDDFLIKNVIARDWHSDGISLQNCRDGHIEDSAATRNRSDGFHSGTTSQRLTWERCSSTFNTGNPQMLTPGDGYFFCWDNQGTVLRKCVFSDNAGAGVGRLGSSGGPLGDRNNTVEDCVIERNGKAGVDLDGCPEANNKVIGNTVRDNSRSDPGRYAGIHLSGGAGKCLVESNTVESTTMPPTQLWGIKEETNTVKNIFRKNRVAKHASGGLVVQPGSTSEENQTD